MRKVRKNNRRYTPVPLSHKKIKVLCCRYLCHLSSFTCRIYKRRKYLCGIRSPDTLVILYLFKGSLIGNYMCVCMEGKKNNRRYTPVPLSHSRNSSSSSSSSSRNSSSSSSSSRNSSHLHVVVCEKRRESICAVLVTGHIDYNYFHVSYW